MISLIVMIKNSVLITGVVGVGKSSLCVELKNRGYEAYDLDMFTDIRVPPPTAAEIEALPPIVGNFHNDDEEEDEDDHNEIIKAYDWIYNRERLADLIIEQNNVLAYYFGVSSNINDLLPYFSKIILLTIPAKLLCERLGANIPMTDEEYVRLSPRWKHDWEKFVAANSGTVVIDASRSLPLIADEIIKESLDVS